ncbi:MAG: hypothetical protein M3550_11290 [Actinomycetota bacterium]|nr:hypothetical protein [Actinomycetota bacterium]
MIASLRRRLARRSLKPQLNQIRTWVRQGRTDAWIAHQLEVSVGDIRSFKREHELVPDEGSNGDEGAPATASDEELDLRAEDDARVAAALEAEQEDEDEDEEAEAVSGEDEGEGEADADADDDKPKRRRRGRRGGRGRRRKTKELEGTFDHGDEGYGLWLDPAIQDDPVYAEHWAGHRPLTVVVEPERIVISRAGEEAGDDEDQD